MSLNPATASLLGIAGTLSAKRAATDDLITIQIRTAGRPDPSVAAAADPLDEDQRISAARAAERIVAGRLVLRLSKPAITVPD